MVDIVYLRAKVIYVSDPSMLQASPTRATRGFCTDMRTRSRGHFLWGRENANGSGTISELATGLSRGSCRKSTVLHNLRLKGPRQNNRVDTFWHKAVGIEKKNYDNRKKKKKGQMLKQARERDKQSSTETGRHRPSQAKAGVGR